VGILRLEYFFNKGGNKIVLIKAGILRQIKLHEISFLLMFNFLSLLYLFGERNSKGFCLCFENKSQRN